MENVILIGMPSCGKSTVGVLLAKAMGLDFLDTDLLIQRQRGQRLCELIAEHGMAGFLALENDTLAALDVHHTVVATGGSAVFGREAMARLHELGRVVYLRLPLEEIERRIGDITTRGVVTDPGETIADVYRRRVPLYEAEADVTVDTDRLTVEQSVQAILEAIGPAS